MTISLAEWLTLRESADFAARSTALTEALAGQLAPQRPLRIVDLGTGTGSNVRYLAPHLPKPQAWLAVDADAAVLGECAARLAADSAFDGQLETRLTTLGEAIDPQLLASRQLVTASALLDLVSERWIDSLAAACRAADACALFALTYDGGSSCEPREIEDDEVRELMNRHQRSSDHGFGRAAGPDAAAITVRAFADAGYEVRRARSDWQLGPEQRELQRELIQGWAAAAIEIAPDRANAIAHWLARRLAHVAAGRSHIAVGHEDIIAWPRSA